MVKQAKSHEQAERLAAIAQLVHSGGYPLDPQRLADALLADPVARERLSLDDAPRRFRDRR